MATSYYIGVRLGAGCRGGRLYLDGASGNTLGGALDLEVGDDVCDLLERHVDVVVRMIPFFGSDVSQNLENAIEIPIFKKNYCCFTPLRCTVVPAGLVGLEGQMAR